MENANNIAKNLQVYLLENILNNIPKNAKLEKKKINGTIIYESPEVKAEKYSINRCLYFDKYNEIVTEFSNKLESHFSHCNLSSFYKNMETLDINDETKDLVGLMCKKSNINAFYNYKDNRIRLVRFKSYAYTLYHELLHLATRKKIGNICLSGFEQETVFAKKGIGRGLDEGYTEYLNTKYFSRKDRNVYKAERKFAQAIERVVGIEQMEQLYFNANLLGLIEYLAKYSSEEVAVDLIKKIDNYYENVNFYHKKKNTLFEGIMTTIANMYQVKISKEPQLGHEEGIRKK